MSGEREAEGDVKSPSFDTERYVLGGFLDGSVCLSFPFFLFVFVVSQLVKAEIPMLVYITTDQLNGQGLR